MSTAGKNFVQTRFCGLDKIVFNKYALFIISVNEQRFFLKNGVVKVGISADI